MVINSWCDVLSIGTAERASAEIGNNRAAIGNTNDDDLVVGRIPSSGARQQHSSLAKVDEILDQGMMAYEVRRVTQPCADVTLTMS